MAAESNLRYRVAQFVTTIDPEEWTLERLGKHFGVSRERIRQIIPEYAKTRRNASCRQQMRLAKMEQYVFDNPQYLLTPFFGGVRSLEPMRRELGYKVAAVFYDDWKTLGLPDRNMIRRSVSQKEWSHFIYITHRERHRASVNKWKAKHPEYKANPIHVINYQNKVIGTSVCPTCNQEFNITNKRRKQYFSGKLMYCSIPCYHNRNKS